MTLFNTDTKQIIKLVAEKPKGISFLKEFVSELETIIYDYCTYYPTEKEIVDYLITNEIEYKASTETIKQIA